MRTVLGAFVLAAAMAGAGEMSIRCDVDGQVRTIAGVNLAANFPKCGHRICELHAVYDRAGRARCPIDGTLAR